jgi:hypothetical protein
LKFVSAGNKTGTAKLAGKERWNARRFELAWQAGSKCAGDS